MAGSGAIIFPYLNCCMRTNIVLIDKPDIGYGRINTGGLLLTCVAKYRSEYGYHELSLTRRPFRPRLPGIGPKLKSDLLGAGLGLNRHPLRLPDYYGLFGEFEYEVNKKTKNP